MVLLLRCFVILNLRFRLFDCFGGGVAWLEFVWSALVVIDFWIDIAGLVRLG